jgi:hypothetical protein
MAPSVWRLYTSGDRRYNKYGAVGGLIIGRGNRITGRKSTPMSLCSPQIPHDLSSCGGKLVTKRRAQKK